MDTTKFFGTEKNKPDIIETCTTCNAGTADSGPLQYC